MLDTLISQQDKWFIEENMSRVLSIIYGEDYSFKFKKIFDTKLYLEAVDKLSKLGADIDLNKVKEDLNIK